MPKAVRTKINHIVLAIFFAVAVLCVPAPILATDFPHFDQMNGEAQAEYLARMVDTLETALRHAGQANQVETLFTHLEPGDAMTSGMAKLEDNVDSDRVADLQRYIKDHTARRLDVEDALFITVKKNMIQLTTPEMIEVLDTMAKFHSTTYAEFLAMPSSGQLRLITMCANWGFFSLRLYNLVQDKQQGKTSDPAEEKTIFQDERQIVNAEFLSESGKPGVLKVMQRIVDAYAKTPNDPGVLYTVTVFILQEADNLYQTQMKQMEDSTYHLPGPGSQSSQTRLQNTAPPSPAAVPSPRPAAEKKTEEPPPAAQNKTEQPDDDPIGEGGFITPPTN